MNNDVEAAIQYAKKYLEDLLSFYGLNTDVYATTEDNEVIELNIPSTHLNGFLIGRLLVQHVVKALWYEGGAGRLKSCGFRFKSRLVAVFLDEIDGCDAGNARLCSGED